MAVCDDPVVVDCGHPPVVDCGNPVVVDCENPVVVDCGNPPVIDCDDPVALDCGHPVALDCGHPVVVDCGNPVVVGCVCAELKLNGFVGAVFCKLLFCVLPNILLDVCSGTLEEFCCVEPNKLDVVFDCELPNGLEFAVNCEVGPLDCNCVEFCCVCPNKDGALVCVEPKIFADVEDPGCAEEKKEGCEVDDCIFVNGFA